MGAVYTKAQKEASKRYADNTDQIRVRTEKGNLEFIKRHAASMNETFGEFVNRAIIETIYRDRGETVVEKVSSDEYGISGTLLQSSDMHYDLDANICGKREIIQMDRVSDVPKAFVSDYGWMALEDEYEKAVLEKD